MSAILVLGAVCILFAVVCVVKFCECVRESKLEAEAMEKWLRERQAYRTSSSIADDSPESASDQSGPRAA